MTPDARAALESALVHVAEDSFFAFAEPPADGWELDWPPAVGWIEATVVFHGADEGRLVCRLPQTLSRELTMAFLGLEPEPGPREGDIEDMIGELANMICGCWLTRAFPTQLFHLERPSVTLGEGRPDAGWLVMLLNGSPLGVSLSVSG